jgi:hypothetical protein
MGGAIYLSLDEYNETPGLMYGYIELTIGGSSWPGTEDISHRQWSRTRSVAAYPSNIKENVEREIDKIVIYFSKNYLYMQDLANKSDK